jgi:two-component system chemotaxis sensor kinase CheA
MDDVDEIITEFLVESHENLDQLDRDLVELEQAPESRPLLASIFRTIHTIKGTSGFLAFTKLERITHVGENLLSRLRDGALALTPERTSALLALVDAVREILASIEAGTGEGDNDFAALVEQLAGLSEDDPAPSAPADAPVAAEPVAAEPVAAEPVVEPVVEHVVEPVVEHVGEPARVVEDETLLGQVLVERGAADPHDVELAVREQQDLGDGRPIGEILKQYGATTDAEVTLALADQADHRRSVADSTVRVDVDLLDSLMRLVGELVLTRNQIVSFSSSLREPTLVRASQRLNLIASELQEGVMKTRMQPIDNVWNKLPRVVRDLARSCGRQVRLELEGRETELDKTILEAIKDPLTHLVRNSVDHGIEAPEARLAAGQPAEGVLRLRAYHESGQVNIEISDDGAGLPLDKIAAKALERGLVPAQDLARMSAKEMRELVFLPGLSTSETVSNVSGRGVGMDVVKTNIEAIGGTVDVDSEPGTGTTFRVKIPLTLAIIPAVTVECAGDRYAIPQVSLVELVSLGTGSGAQAIEDISGAPVYRLRGRLLPLVALHEALGLSGEQRAGSSDDEREATIAVLQADGQQFGLLVDRVLDTEEIVVKPLSAQLKRIAEYAGATILGDGRVALILDVMALARNASVLTSHQARAELDALHSLVEGLEGEPQLVVGLGEGRRVAVPLSTVTRLEQFPLSTVEHVGGREVVQYRGKILPLLRLADHLGAFSSGEAGQDSLQVVVYAEGERSVGLVVEQILDITHETVQARSDLDSHGVVGSAVIQERVTELLDVQSAILAADPRFFDEAAHPLYDDTLLASATDGVLTSTGDRS